MEDRKMNAITTLKFPAYVPGFGMVRVLETRRDGDNYVVERVLRRKRWENVKERIELAIKEDAVVSRQFVPSATLDLAPGKVVR